jgi:hypothetical protein
MHSGGAAAKREIDAGQRDRRACGRRGFEHAR